MSNNMIAVFVFLSAAIIGANIYYLVLFDASGDIVIDIVDAILPTPNKMGYGIIYMVFGICLAYVLFFLPYIILCWMAFYLLYKKRLKRQSPENNNT